MASEKITANTITNTVTATGPTGMDGAGNGSGMSAGAGRPPGAAGAVWDALTANPGGTVAGIAAGAQVSRATVARVLTALERDGRAVRSRGARDSGKRQPDTWQAVTPDTAIGTDQATDNGHVTDADETTGQATPVAPSGNAGPVTDADRATGTDGTPDTDIDTGAASTADDRTADGAAPDMDTGDVTGGDAAGMDAAAVAEARDALTVLGAAIGDALTALDRGDGPAALTAIEAVYGGSGRARRLVRSAANGRPRTTTGRPRSPRGEMRMKVEAHLAAHPGVEFTAHEVGKALGHSAGAVSNALDRLAEMGSAALVCERPRRFTAAPTH